MGEPTGERRSARFGRITSPSREPTRGGSARFADSRGTGYATSAGLAAKGTTRVTTPAHFGRRTDGHAVTESELYQAYRNVGKGQKVTMEPGKIVAAGVSGNPIQSCAASICVLTPHGGRRLHLGSKAR